MTAYVLAIPEQPIVYPLTRAGLRAAYPTTLLPEGFAGLEELHVFPITPTDKPEYDPNTHEAVEIDPELIGDTWTQAWDVVELPVPIPQPRWQDFAIALNESEEVRALLVVARDNEPALFGQLAVGVGQAAEGSNETLKTALGIAASKEMITPELVGELMAMAQLYDLPAAFVALLSELE